MNQYNSKLKGWAVDRVIELAKIAGSPVSIAELQAQADQLAAYAYVPEEDLNISASHVIELFGQAPDDADTAGAVAMMIGALESIQSRLTHAPKEKVQ